MKTGRHAIGAVTEPMTTVRPATAPATKPTAPPINPEPETEAMRVITPVDVAAYDRARKAITDTNEWMAPLRPGGPQDRRTELTLRIILRSRGLALWRTLRKAVGR